MPRSRSRDIAQNAIPILVGTASWTEPTLIKCGQFYPPEVKTAEARLRYYANEFPLVEVDSTYYALPSARNAALWAKRTPANFVFDVKAFRLLTQHQTEPKFLPPAVRDALGQWDKKNVYYDDLPKELLDEIWRELEAGLAPLVAAGKLGALLFQFPRWFVMRRASFDHIREIRRRLAHYPLAIEFRHESWFSNSRHRDATLDFLRELGVANVTVDELPGLPGSIPMLWDVTNPKLAILRLHGRNAATWNKRDSLRRRSASITTTRRRSWQSGAQERARHTAGQGKGSRAGICCAGAGLEYKGRAAPREFTPLFPSPRLSVSRKRFGFAGGG